LKSAIKQQQRPIYFTDCPTSEELKLLKLQPLNPFLAAQLISFAYSNALDFESLLTQCLKRDGLTRACHGISESMVDQVCKALQELQESSCIDAPNLGNLDEALGHDSVSLQISACQELSQQHHQVQRMPNTTHQLEDGGTVLSMGKQSTEERCQALSQLPLTRGATCPLRPQAAYGRTNAANPRPRLVSPPLQCTLHLDNMGGNEALDSCIHATGAVASQALPCMTEKHAPQAATSDGGAQEVPLLLATAKVHKNPRLLPPEANSFKRRRLASPGELGPSSFWTSRQPMRLAGRLGICNAQVEHLSCTPMAEDEHEAFAADPCGILEETPTAMHLHGFSVEEADIGIALPAPTPIPLHGQRAGPIAMSPSTLHLQYDEDELSSSEEDLEGLLQSHARPGRPRANSTCGRLSQVSNNLPPVPGFPSTAY
jgi:hypothetical protein